MPPSSDNPNTRNAGKSPDPYLRAFLRQAVAIVASEKGFNDVSNAKLRAAADQLGLSEKTFQHAIDQLKTPESNLGLNRYEKEFAKFLSTEFEKMRGDVITVRAERSLVDLAENKFQIDSIRAHQLIQKLAEQCGVGTISHSDAIQFVQQLVEDTIGQQTTILQSETDRLYRVCQKWGMPPAGVDKLIESNFAENRSQRRRRILSLLAISIVGTGMLAIGSWQLSQINWIERFSPAEKSSFNVVEIGEDSINRPKWWHHEIVEAAVAVGHQNTELSRLIAAAVTADANERNTIYRKFVDFYLEQRLPNRELENLIALYYSADPHDRATVAMMEGLTAPLITTPGNAATVSQIRSSRFAAILLGRMLYVSNSRNKTQRPNRLIQLTRINDQYLSIDFNELTERQYLIAAEDTLTLEQWSQAVGLSRSNPKAIAAILSDLEQRNTDNIGAAVNELRTITVHNILDLEPLQWRTIRTSIIHSINDSPLIDSWVQLAQKTKVIALRDFLRESMTKKSGRFNKAVGPMKFADLDIHTHLHPNLDLRIARMTNARIRLQVKKTESTLNSLGLNDNTSEEVTRIQDVQSPKILFDLIRINNLQLGWIEAVLHDTADIESLQRQFERPTTTFPMVLGPPDSGTPSEKRRLSAAISKINQSAPGQQSARISALSEIEALANKFADIAYKDATDLIAYMMKINNEREVLAIERALPALRLWPNLLLAFADSVESTTENLELLKTGLIDVQASEQPPDSNEEIHKMLLQKCQELLQNQVTEYRRSWLKYHDLLRNQLAIRVRSISEMPGLTTEYRVLVRGWLDEHFDNNSLWIREYNLIDSCEDPTLKMLRLNSLWWRSYCHLRQLDFQTVDWESRRTSNIQETISLEYNLFQILREQRRKLSHVLN